MGLARPKGTSRIHAHVSCFNAVDAALLLVALGIASGYLLLGVGPVMDDWYALNNVHFGGVWAAAGDDQIAARPVASLAYSVIFGWSGRSVVPALLLMAALNAGTAVLLRRLLLRVAPPHVAALAALLWVWLPTTTALEAWASAVNISLALAAAMAAISINARESAPRWAELPLLAVVSAGAVLSYEAVLVLIIPCAALILHRHRSRDTLIRSGVAIASSTAAFGWMVAHWHPNKRITSAWGDIGAVIPANFGWGVAPSNIGPLIIVFVLVCTVVVFSSSAGDMGVAPLRRAVAIGWAIVVLGVLPFVKYTYAPVGAGDRVNVVSSLGGATVLAACISVAVANRWRRLLLAGAVLAAVALPPRLLMMRSWSLASQDGAAISVAVRSHAKPGDRVVLGPALVDRNGVTAMQHPDIFERAVELFLDDRSSAGTITTNAEEFGREVGVKIDVRRVIKDPEQPGRR